MAKANQRISEYVLEERIGAGGFGEVWRAHHHVWADQLVAVKIPTDPQYIRELQREGIVVHGLVHPSIVRAIGFDPYADEPYLVMEYVPGTSLRALIGRKSLGVAESVAIMRQVLAALAYAHERNLVHRDIKPENILIHEGAGAGGFGRPGSVKVTDFGLGKVSSRAAAESIAMTMSVRGDAAARIVGTLDYMAPEQRGGGDVDGRADLYACGVMLYEMLTGERPQGHDVPSDLNANVPEYLDAAFRGAFARLDRRVSSAEGFDAALEAAPPLLPLPRAVATAPSAPPPLPRAVASAARPAGDRVIENSVGMKLVRIEKGTFTMGSPDSEEGRFDDETAHEVTLTRGFRIGATQVTQAQWKAVMGNEPSLFKGDDLPVEQVSWDEAVEFCSKLSATEVKEGRKYRLPNEAEWEYACRAGSRGPFAGTGKLDDMGWYADNSGDAPLDSQRIWDTDQANYWKRIFEDNKCRTHPVAQKRQNAGLYDMHGNVWEWCSDWQGDYPSDRVTNPSGPAAGASRVVRGGSWATYPRYCRSADRHGYAPDVRNGSLGFRVCLDLE